MAFEVLTAIGMNFAMFWDIVPRSQYVNQRLGEMSVLIWTTFQKKETLVSVSFHIFLNIVVLACTVFKLIIFK